MELILVDDSLINETAKFASEVFIDYYTPINGFESASYMAKKFLSVEAIKELIKNGAIFKVLIKGHEIIGFIEYLKEDKRLFLSKFYLHKNYRHLGLGKYMFDDILNYAKEKQLDNIYLTVNKHNTPSYQIYLHLGFKVIDAVKTDIGQGYIMDDYIMQKDLISQ